MNCSSQSFLALLRRRALLNVMVPKEQLSWKRSKKILESPPSSSRFFFEIFCPKFQQKLYTFFTFFFFFSIIVDSIQLKQQNLDVVVSVVTVRTDCA